MWNSSGTSHVFGVMESSRDEDAYQRHRTDHNAPRRLTAQTEFSLSQESLNTLNSMHGQQDEPERTELQLIRIQKPLLLPTVEPNLPSSTEGQERKSNNDSGNTIMEVNNLFSRPHGLFNLKTTPPTSNEDHIKFKNRGVSSNPKVSEITLLTYYFQKNDVSDVDRDTALSNSAF
ncbi:hypothetical protein AYI70_g9283 [Smittium culicis]|uniref:Uncharacterized protein n=1 Tax=Smittium culicis TaxID=133412 RepID=A0A1R1XC38_9FUNG|nr:hypothetical protein AYI70_g9283 [Smittium culicis]